MPHAQALIFPQQPPLAVRTIFILLICRWVAVNKGKSIHITDINLTTLLVHDAEDVSELKGGKIGSHLFLFDIAFDTTAAAKG
jgi:hypothetical protein